MSTQRITKRVTLRQVADLAGVSVSAASTVLSGLTNTISVPPPTQEKIKSAARTLGYRRRRNLEDNLGDASRQRAVPGKTLHIGVIAAYEPIYRRPESDPNPWHHDIGTAFEAEFIKSGSARITFFNRFRTNGLPINVADAAAAVRKFGVEVLVLIDLGQAQHIERYVLDLEAAGLPYVIVCACPLMVPAPHVCYDNQLAGFKAAAHLIESGHRSLAVFAPVAADWANNRIRGAIDAARYYGLPDGSVTVFPEKRRPLHDGPNVAHDPLTRDEAVGCAAAAREAGIEATGIIGVNDEAALAFMDALAIGEKTPRRFGIIGFDDIPEARYRGLSTLRAPREAMGREAAGMVLQILDDPNARKQVCLQSDLVRRASTMDC